MGRLNKKDWIIR